VLQDGGKEPFLSFDRLEATILQCEYTMHISIDSLCNDDLSAFGSSMACW